MAQPARSGGSNMALWIVLIVLLLGGAGAGVYFGFFHDKDGTSSSAGSGSTVAGGDLSPTPAPPPPGPSIDAAVAGNDPWKTGVKPDQPDVWDKNQNNGTPSTPPPAEDDTDDPPPPEEEDDEDVAIPAKGKIPAVCENYISIMERYSRCKILPKDTGEQLRQTAKQMRGQWANIPWTKDIVKQVNSACRQGAEAMENAMTSLNCD